MLYAKWSPRANAHADAALSWRHPLDLGGGFLQAGRDRLEEIRWKTLGQARSHLVDHRRRPRHDVDDDGFHVGTEAALLGRRVEVPARDLRNPVVLRLSTQGHRELELLHVKLVLARAGDGPRREDVVEGRQAVAPLRQEP